MLLGRWFLQKLFPIVLQNASYLVPVLLQYLVPKLCWRRNQEYSSSVYDRDKLMRTQTPQAFSLGKLLWAHEQAKKLGITGSVASCTLMIELGETVYFSHGSEKTSR